MSWWTRATSPKPRGDEDLVCAMCGAHRAHVTRMVAGPGSMALCEACVRASFETLDGEIAGDDRIAWSYHWVTREIELLPHGTPRATVRKLVRAAVALAEDAHGTCDPETCRALATMARQAGDPESALFVLEHIAPAERNADDDVSAAVYLGATGATEAALAQLEAIDPAALSDFERTLLPLHLAYFRLEAGRVGPGDASTLERMLDRTWADIETLELDEATRASLARQVALLRARTAFLAGHYARAEALARAHLVTTERDPEMWAVLFAVLRSRGEEIAAREARLNALRFAHPEGLLAARLRDASTGPFR